MKVDPIDVTLVPEHNRPGGGTFYVHIVTPFSVERGEAIESIMPGDPDYDPERGPEDRPYESWHVWDESKDDYASDEASHFDTRQEAEAWIRRHIATVA
jgi:hypothetical protein